MNVFGSGWDDLAMGLALVLGLAATLALVELFVRLKERKP